MLALILSVVFFFVFFFLQVGARMIEESISLTAAESHWSSLLQSFGSLVFLTAQRRSIRADEVNALKVLSELLNLSQAGACYAFFGTTDGRMLIYPTYEFEPSYDPRERPWYKAAVRNPNSFVLSPPFEHAILKEIVVVVSKAVFDEDGNLLGVVGVDIVPERITTQFLDRNMYIVNSNGEVLFKGEAVRLLFQPSTYPNKEIYTKLAGLTLVFARRSLMDTFVVKEVSVLSLMTLPIANGMAIFLSAFISLLFSTKFIRKRMANELEKPLSTIIQQARNYLQSENFDISGCESRILEVRELIGELGDMMTIIEATTEELRTTNKELEEAYYELEKKNLQIEEAYELFATKLARIVESFDEHTGGHVRRVQALSKYFAEKLGLDNKLVSQIEKFSPLHDIGKIGIPKEILNKPGKLTQEEWELVKKHTTIGASLLSGSEKLTVARNIALYHHEKFDGSGYPEGLSDDQIPIEAQIVGFVDVYDALRSSRPYKPPYPHEKAVGIILNGDGHTKPQDFNPKILQVFRENENEIRLLWDSITEVGNPQVL